MDHTPVIKPVTPRGKRKCNDSRTWRFSDIEAQGIIEPQSLAGCSVRLLMIIQGSLLANM